MEYQHGGDVYSHSVEMDYSANINPLGLPRGVRAALREAVEGPACCIYPDSSCRALTAELAAFHGLLPEWIICGNGAADLIFSLAFALRPRRGLVTAPTFGEYRQALEAAGCQVDGLFLEQEGLTLSRQALAERLHQAGREGRP